jgi:hypothetical protein
MLTASSGFNDSFEVLDANGHRDVLRLSCPRGEADDASETCGQLDLDALPRRWLPLHSLDHLIAAIANRQIHVVISLS